MSLVKLFRQQASPWAILAIVCLPVFIGALDLTIISAVLPEVIVSLDLPVKEYLDQASWAVNGYLLAYAISMTFTGRLSDIVGRRTIYIGCLLVFMVGSYLVTMYDNPTINSNNFCCPLGNFVRVRGIHFYRRQRPAGRRKLQNVSPLGLIP